MHCSSLVGLPLAQVCFPTSACMSWGCPEGANADVMWTSGPCSCSFPSPALTLAQHPSYELFQASLPTQESAWALPALVSEVISGLISETQKGSPGFHTSWLKSHPSSKPEINYTCSLPVFHDLALSVSLLSPLSWKFFLSDQLYCYIVNKPAFSHWVPGPVAMCSSAQPAHISLSLSLKLIVASTPEPKCRSRPVIGPRLF